MYQVLEDISSSLQKMQFKELKSMKKFIIVFVIFAFDRATKFYLIDLQSSGVNIDFYVNPFLNFNLHMNTGIGFGLVSMDASVYYHILTFVIAIVNLGLLVFLWKSKGIYAYLSALILGGSLGNLFDRLYYSAVPDFLDFHINNFHWFIFNLADIYISIGVICLIIDEVIFKKKSHDEN